MVIIMEIRRLCANDYDELLAHLNLAFKRNNFDRLLPKMWVKDDDYMGKHIGLWEDGKLCSVVGIYPFDVKIGDAQLKFATTGNVATHPDYEGRGYFTALFELVMKELESGGYDGARLGGARQRYGRFGYEPCGTVYKFTFTEANRVKCFDGSYRSIIFEELTENDTDALTFINELSTAKPFYVERCGKYGLQDVFGTLGAKSSDRFIAKRGNELIGYLCVNEGNANLTEINANNTENYMAIICAWQEKVQKDIRISVLPYMIDEFNVLSDIAQDMSVATPSLFKILNFETVCDALMKLAFSLKKMPVGEFYINVEDYGVLRFFVNENGAGCKKTVTDVPAISLSKNKAELLLFGPMPPSMYFPQNAELNAWLPLPLSWNRLDAV